VIRAARRARVVTIGLALVTVASCGRESAPAAAAAPAEIGVIRTASPVTGFALARTGVAATMSRDRKLRIVSFPDGAVRHTIDVAGRAIDAFTISPDGRFVAIGDHTGVLSVWATDSEKLVLDIRLPRYPGFITFSPDGATLATAAQGDPVRLIDVASGKTKATLGSPTGGTGALAFSPDGRRVATGDGDTVVRVYDAVSGKLSAENRDFLLVPLTVGFTADGASVIAASGDKVVMFVDAATGRATRRLDRTAQPVMYLDVSPDGRSLVTVYMKSEDMTQPDHVVIRDLATGQQQTDWLPPRMPAGAGWTSDGRLIAAIAAPDALHLWRVR
jgi:WD40 repeat protein